MWQTVDIFCETVLMNKSNITFEVTRSSSCVFKKVLRKNIFTTILVFKSSKGFGWNNDSPASQTVAQNCGSIERMHCVIWVVASLATER